MYLIADATGLAGLVDALQAGLTTDAFMNTLTAFVPVVLGVVLFAFAWRIARKLIKGASKGKANI